ncbi:HalOD1 output domain-containing protein [Haladaptatus sp. NG-SE-30]
MQKRTNDRGDGHLTVDVLDAVMEAAGYEDLGAFESCLYDVIDPDALDSLFHQRSVDGYVEFTWDGFEVRVHSDGQVEVSDT